jgi:hypothetical protein
MLHQPDIWAPPNVPASGSAGGAGGEYELQTLARGFAAARPHKADRPSLPSNAAAPPPSP